LANLKVLKERIASVASTKKITSAMKMVAASKLRRAQEQAEAARPFSERMFEVMASVAGGMPKSDDMPKLLAGTGKEDTYLIVLATSERGLCGGFNANLVRAARRKIQDLKAEGKKAGTCWVVISEISLLTPSICRRSAASRFPMRRQFQTGSCPCSIPAILMCA
jgi:ATP synthase F1 gamma subunit